MNHWVSLFLSSDFLALCCWLQRASYLSNEFQERVQELCVQGRGWILWWGRDDAQESAVGRNPAFWFYFPLVLLCFVTMTNSVSSCFRRNSSSSSVMWWVRGEYVVNCSARVSACLPLPRSVVLTSRRQPRLPDPVLMTKLLRTLGVGRELQFVSCGLFLVATSHSYCCVKTSM